MKLEMGDLRIYYRDQSKINSELDNALEEVLKKFGYTRWASGCETATGIRDLAFDKES